MNRTWKNAVAVIFTLLSLCHTLCAQQPPWSRLHNFCGDTSIYSSNHVCQYADDNVIIAAGHTYTPGVSLFHSYIGSFDYQGNLLYHKSLLNPGPYNSIIGARYGYPTNVLGKMSGDKYLLIGTELNPYANSKIKTVEQTFFYFFNSHCDSIACKRYADTIISYRPYSLLVDNGKNIIVTGQITSQSIHYDPFDQNYYYDSVYIWVAKYDSNANELWSQKFHAHDIAGQGSKVIMGHNGLSYIISAAGYDAALGKGGTMIIKTDLSGNIIWQKFLTDSLSGVADITQLKDGGYGFVSTVSVPPAVLSGDICYGTFDEQGDVIWSRRWRDTNYYQGQMITEADNGDLLLFGKSYYYGDVNVLLRTTPGGEIKAYREYRHKDTITPSVTQSLVAMSYTPQKQILLNGKFSSPLIPGYFDSAGIFSWMALTDTFGCLEPGCQSLDTMWHVGVKDLHKSNSKIHIFPNPVNNELIIEGASTGTSFQLFDMLGRAVYRGLINRAKQNINTSALVAGTYILQLTSLNGERAMYKVVKE